MIRKKVILSLLFSFLTVLIITSCTGGGEPEVEVRDVTIVSSGMMKGVASSFMRIINSGSSDVLTGCSIKEYPSARGELHDFIDGRMTRVREVKIPAHETTELKKEALHTMFFDIQGEMSKPVTLILSFRKSGKVEVNAKRRSR